MLRLHAAQIMAIPARAHSKSTIQPWPCTKSSIPPSHSNAQKILWCLQINIGALVSIVYQPLR